MKGQNEKTNINQIPEKLKKLIITNNDLSLELAQKFGVKQESIIRNARRNSASLLSVKLISVYEKYGLTIEDLK